MNELRKLLDELLDHYNEIKRIVQQEDRQIYEQWKAGGFIIDEDILSMYPNVVDVVNKIADDMEEDEDDDVVYVLFDPIAEEYVAGCVTLFYPTKDVKKATKFDMVEQAEVFLAVINQYPQWAGSCKVVPVSAESERSEHD